MKKYNMSHYHQKRIDSQAGEEARWLSRKVHRCVLDNRPPQESDTARLQKLVQKLLQDLSEAKRAGRT